MPSGLSRPRGMVQVEFDASVHHAATPALSLNGNNVSLDSTVDLYEDMSTFLNGRGYPAAVVGGNHSSEAAAPSQIMTQAAVGVPPDPFDWWVYIDGHDFSDTDRIVIRTDGGVFTLAAAAANAVWGLPVAGATSVLVNGVGPDQWIVGTAPWSRRPIGLAGLSPLITIDPNGAPVPFTWPIAAESFIWESIPTFLRKDSEGDVDALAPTDNLSTLSTAAAGGTVHWSLDETGHTIMSTELGAAFGPTWLAGGLSLRNFLGFTGFETAQAAPAAYWRSTRPCRGVMDLPFGLSHQVPRSVSDVRSRRGPSGKPRGALYEEHLEWTVRFYVHGLAFEAASEDRSSHWIDLTRLAPPTKPWTIYPQWGDPRRRADPASGLIYDKVYNREFGGRRGRIRAFRDPADGAQEWDSEGESDILFRSEPTVILTQRLDDD